MLDASTDAAVAPLDLSASECLTRREIDWARSVYERVASAVSSTLSTTLRYTIEAKLGQMEQVGFPAVAPRLGSSSCVFLLSLTSGAGPALIALDAKVAMAFVEVILGGAPRAEDGPQRDVTDVELALLQDVANVLRREWELAWQNYLDLELAFESTGMESQKLESVLGFGTLLLVQLEATLGDAAGEILLALPTRIIRNGIRAKEQARRQASASSDVTRQAQVLLHLESCSMDVRACLEGATASFRELLELRPGDVLQLAYPLNHPITGRVNSARKFSGEIVGIGMKRGVMIHELHGEKGSP